MTKFLKTIMQHSKILFLIVFLLTISNVYSKNVGDFIYSNGFEILFMGKEVKRIEVQDEDQNLYSVNSAGDTLTLTGNTWKAIRYPYSVTPNTLLKFDFRSVGQEPEINGIGFTNNLSQTPISGRGWQVYGTQNWIEAQTFDNYTGNDWKSYTIPIGNTFTGNINYMVFVVNDDNVRVNQISEYRNPEIIESVNLDIGVDYHAYGSDFTNQSFITDYHNANTRSIVINQLQSMANKNVDRIFLRIYMVRHDNSTNFDSWRLMFPPTTSELNNIKSFVTDIANVTGSQGQKLQLDICLLWGGAANFNEGSISDNTGLGNQGYTPANFQIV